MNTRCPIEVSPVIVVAPILKTRPLALGVTQKPMAKISKKKEIVDLPQFTTKLLDEIKVIENENSIESKIQSKIQSQIPIDPIEPGSSPADSQDSGAELQAPIGSTNGTSSGYGSEGYVSEEERKLKSVETLKVLDIRDEHTHCARCHKTFDPLSGSNAEKRCLLPHPTKMVIPIRRDGDGTHFVCLCCRTEFKLPKMTFYEAGVNSMLTGYCFIGQHTADQDDIDFQYDGGAALSCEEAGCIEFFV